MPRIIKVFAQGAEQERLAKRYPVVQRYPAFILLEISESEAASLSKKQLLEDITEQYQVQLGKQTIDTGENVSPAGVAGEFAVSDLSFTPSPPELAPTGESLPATHHYLVVFNGPILQEWLQAIQDAGGELRVPYQNFTYVINANPTALEKINQLPFVRWTGRLPVWARIASSIRERDQLDDHSQALPRTHTLPSTYLLEFFSPNDLLPAVSQLNDLRITITAQDERAGILVIELTGNEQERASLLEALAAVHGVRSIRERTIKRTSNDMAPTLMGTVRCINPGPLGLNGKGEIIGIADTGLDSGDIQNLHPDFAGRVIGLRSYPITEDYNAYLENPGADDGPADTDTGHGTHVAGSVAGSGAASLSISGQAKPIRGLAYQAQIYFQSIEQEMQWKNPAFFSRYGRFVLSGIPLDLHSLFDDAYAQGVRIHSNSWGGGDPGAYDTQCEQLDHFVWTHKDFLILVSAGNDGTDADQDGKVDPQSVSSPGTAKNCLTVGASESRRRSFNHATYGRWWPNDYPVPPLRDDPMADDLSQVAAFSSRGPTLDGRIKPDILAPGTFILSTRSTRLAANNMAWGSFPRSRLYFYNGGTSMSTPLAAGAAAIVRQFLREKRSIQNPSAALIKAVLIASAKKIKSTAPKSAMFDNEQGYGLINLDNILAPPDPVQVFMLDITPGLFTGELVEFQFQVVSHNSPLRLVLAYSDYPGRSLVNNLNLVLRSPTGRIYAGNASRGKLALDHKNNVEIFQSPKPRPGLWQASIIGANIPHGPQDFALVLRGHIEML